MAGIIDLHIANTAANAAFQPAALASANAFSADVNVHQVNGATTVLQARLAGFAQGTAPYVSWLDSDDLVTNLDPVVAFLNAKQPDALFTNSNIVDVNGNVVEPWYPSTFKFDKDRLFQGGKPPHQLVVIKRSLINNAMLGVEQCATALGMTNVQSWPAEYALAFEIALVTNWIYFDQMCYQWRQHSSGQMHTTSTQHFGAILKYYQNKRKHTHV